SAIVRLTQEVESTREELQEDFNYALANKFRRVILITSPYHTRRVRTIWDFQYESMMAALVSPTPFEPFDPDRWWRSRHELELSVHELLGVAHFLVGSPLPRYSPRP